MFRPQPSAAPAEVASHAPHVDEPAGGAASSDDAMKVEEPSGSAVESHFAEFRLEAIDYDVAQDKASVVDLDGRLSENSEDSVDSDHSSFASNLPLSLARLQSAALMADVGDLERFDGRVLHLTSPRSSESSSTWARAGF